MVSARPREVQSYYGETTAAWLRTCVCTCVQACWSQSTTLPTPFASAAASGSPPPLARGVKILLSKPSTQEGSDSIITARHPPTRQRRPDNVTMALSARSGSRGAPAHTFAERRSPLRCGPAAATLIPDEDPARGGDALQSVRPLG